MCIVLNIQSRFGTLLHYLVNDLGHHTIKEGVNGKLNDRENWF